MLTRGYGDVDLAAPVDWDHPDNAGLVRCLVGLPGVAGGRRWADLAQRSDGGSLTTNNASFPPVWGGTGRGDVGLTFNSSRLHAATLGAVPSGAECTVAAWVRPTSVAFTSYEIYSSSDFGTNGDGWRLCLSGDNPAVWQWYKYVGYSGSSVVSDAGATAGAWVRLVGTCDAAGDLRLYLDGVPQASTANKTGTVAANLATVGKRADSSSSGYYLTGGVSDVRVYTRGVDAGWVARDYEWSRDVQRDPRLRHLSRAAWLVGTGGGANYTLAADVSPVAVSAHTVGLPVTRRLPIDAAAVAVTAPAVGHARDYRLPADVNSATVTTPAVGLVYDAADPVLTVTAGAVTVSAAAVGLTAARRLTTDSSPVAVTVPTVGVLRGARLLVDGAAVSAGTPTVTLTYSGGSPPPPPAPTPFSFFFDF